MAALIVAAVAALLGLVAGAMAGRLVEHYVGESRRRRSPFVAVTMAASWAAVATVLGRTLPWAVPAALVLVFFCVTLGTIDGRTRRLPNRLTYPAFPVVSALLVLASAGEDGFGRLLRALLAAALVGGVFLLLGVAIRGGIGLGDVKFAPTLALALGWLSWSAVLLGFLAAFLLAGLAGLVAMLALGRGRKDTLAFGPWLAVGTVLALVVAGTVGTASVLAT